MRSVNPKFLFGSGKVSEMSGMVSASEADAVFVNAPLSGAQQKGLTDQWGGAAVLDRFRVILDIFADRARTTEAKLQASYMARHYSVYFYLSYSGVYMLFIFFFHTSINFCQRPPPLLLSFTHCSLPNTTSK